jgi:hypothetical protein
MPDPGDLPLPKARLRPAIIVVVAARRDMEFAGRRMRRDGQSPLPIEQEFRILSAGVTGEWAGRRPPSKLDYRWFRASGPNQRASPGGPLLAFSAVAIWAASNVNAHRLTLTKLSQMECAARFLASPDETQLEPKQNMARRDVLW